MRDRKMKKLTEKCVGPYKIKKIISENVMNVTNFIQLVSPQPVDLFSQTKLHWKAPIGGYLCTAGYTKATTND